MLLKACDISNEVRPREVAEQWLDSLLKEYFQQSDREKEEGRPVLCYMDPDKLNKTESQINFIKSVILPIFELIAKVRPDTNLALFLAHYYVYQLSLIHI